MGKTYKDQRKWNDKGIGKKKFPRVPLPRQRSEPFEDERFKETKHPHRQDEMDEVIAVVQSDEAVDGEDFDYLDDYADYPGEFWTDERIKEQTTSPSV